VHVAKLRLGMRKNRERWHWRVPMNRVRYLPILFINSNIRQRIREKPLRSPLLYYVFKNSMPLAKTIILSVVSWGRSLGTKQRIWNKREKITNKKESTSTFFQKPTKTKKKHAKLFDTKVLVIRWFRMHFKHQKRESSRSSHLLFLRLHLHLQHLQHLQPLQHLPQPNYLPQVRLLCTKARSCLRNSNKKEVACRLSQIASEQINLSSSCYKTLWKEAENIKQQFFLFTFNPTTRYDTSRNHNQDHDELRNKDDLNHSHVNQCDDHATLIDSIRRTVSPQKCKFQVENMMTVKRDNNKAVNIHGSMGVRPV